MAHVPAWLERPQDLVESVLSPLFSWCHDRGLEAMHLSLAQAPLVAAVGWLILVHRFQAASVVLLASLVFDLADGSYARATGTASRRGHVVDKAMDLLGIAVFVSAVLVVRPGLWLPLSLAGATTAVLYALGWSFDPELVTGVRAAGLVWLFVPSVTLLLWLPGIAGLLQVPYAVWARRPKEEARQA